MALAVDAVALAAVGTFKIAHILDDTEDRYIHELSHLDSLLNDHRDKLLRRSNYNDTVNGKRLENSQRNIACSGGHINDQTVNILPDNVCPELLYNSCDNGTSPYNGIGLVFQKKIDRHDIKTHLALSGDNAEFAGISLLMDTESLGYRGTCYISVHDTDILAQSLERNGEQRRNEGLTDTALTAYNADDLADIAHGIGLFEKALGLCSAAAA